MKFRHCVFFLWSNARSSVVIIPFEKFLVGNERSDIIYENSQEKLLIKCSKAQFSYHNRIFLEFQSSCFWQTVESLLACISTCLLILLGVKVVFSLSINICKGSNTSLCFDRENCRTTNMARRKIIFLSLIQKLFIFVSLQSETQNVIKREHISSLRKQRMRKNKQISNEKERKEKW